MNGKTFLNSKYQVIKTSAQTHIDKGEVGEEREQNSIGEPQSALSDGQLELNIHLSLFR